MTRRFIHNNKITANVIFRYILPPFTDSSTTEHKIRVCSENQIEEFLLAFLILLNFLTTLSVIASVQLENLTDYMYFYKSTSTFLCFPTKKVVHRSLVFTLASSDEYEELLQEVTRDKVMINRPRRGKTPLHYSTEMNAPSKSDPTFHYFLSKIKQRSNAHNVFTI